MFAGFLYFMKYQVVIWSSNIFGCTASSTYDSSALKLAIWTYGFMHNRYGILFHVILHTWTLHLICVVCHYDASSHCITWPTFYHTVWFGISLSLQFSVSMSFSPCINPSPVFQFPDIWNDTICSLWEQTSPSTRTGVFLLTSPDWGPIINDHLKESEKQY